MNKQQIIFPLVAMALFLVVLSFTRKGPTKSDIVQMNASTLGQDLIEQTNSLLLAEFSPDLQKSLKEFLASPSKVDPRPPPHTEKIAYIQLGNAKREKLGILLQWDQNLRKFRPIRHWYPEAPPDSDR